MTKISDRLCTTLRPASKTTSNQNLKHEQVNSRISNTSKSILRQSGCLRAVLSRVSASLARRAGEHGVWVCQLRGASDGGEGARGYDGPRYQYDPLPAYPPDPIRLSA